MDTNNIDVPKAILFDLDGTLYSSKKMQVYMFLKLCSHLIFHPSDWRILNIISTFRTEREHHAGEIYVEPTLLKEQQFQWVADTLKLPIEKIKNTIEQWMYTVPLIYINRCKYKEVDTVLSVLKERNISFAIVSDYPVDEKINSMHISADIRVSALDLDINALKPCPKGFIQAAARLGYPIEQCWIVGDRDDRDGEAARAAGTVYIQGLKALLTKLQMKSEKK